MKLRSYQQEAVDKIGAALASDGSTLIVVPTACGKTVIFSHYIAQQKQRTLVLAHREELIFQAANKIKAITGIAPEIEMAEHRAPGSLWVRSPVLVSSVQTQNAGRDSKRMELFDPMEFGLIVIDEAHHAPADSYGKIIGYYKEKNPAIKILGVTATPDRADEVALGKIFESVAFDYEITDAIRDGWIVPVSQRAVFVEGLDFSQCRTVASDLNGADLAAVMEFESVLHGVVSPVIELAGERKTLVFAASLVHAERMCDILNRHRNGCARFVHGGTPKEDRRDMLVAYNRGEFQYLVNVGVATEGFDEPGIEFVVMARPTKSRSLYAQMAGRGFRPHESIANALGDIEDAEGRRALILASPKPRLELLDFCGNSGRHRLQTGADILGGNYSDEAKARAAKKAADADGLPVDVAEALEESEKEVRLEAERARLAKLKATAKYKTVSIDPFDAFGIQPTEDRGWNEGRPASKWQIDRLLSKGIAEPERMSYTKAKQLLDGLDERRAKGLCTLKQANQLAKKGIDPANVTFERASQVMDVLAKNGWRLPPGFQV